jgi:hypothetical protein
MNIYIDCEWNDYKGDLISMALVAADGQEFYEVLKCDNPSEWVANNVMNVLEKEPVSKDEFDLRLKSYLDGFDNINIIADWPEDIERFCNALITGPGTRFGPGSIKFEFNHDLFSSESKVPHNALWDARAIAATNKS